MKRDTLGSLVTMGNQVCRYTMLTRPPEPMLSAILGASGAAKMPFYEAADHVFASPSQLDHVHTYTYVLARSPHGPRARRSTGEMFQSTRLKGQLTLSCLAARIVVVLSALSLSTCCPPPCLLVSSCCLYPTLVVLCSLYSRRAHFSFRLISGAHRVSRYYTCT